VIGVTAVAAATAVLLAVGSSAADPAVPSLGLQTEEPESASVQVLQLGEAYSGPGYQLVADGSFFDASPLRVGYSELRVGILVHNTSPLPLPYSDFGLPNLVGLPRLIVVDSQADIYPVDLLHPVQGSQPGADLISIEPGMSARWTLGFQVPTATVASARLVLVDGGQWVAEWDLSTEPVSTGFLPEPDAVVTLGDSIPWDTQVRAAVTEYGSLTCGDPSIEPVAQIVGVTVEVSNTDNAEYLWPSVAYPTVPSIVQWADGGAAKAVLETFVGDRETLERVDGATTVLPPQSTEERAWVMAAPRDGRFVTVSAPPRGVWLYPPAGGSVFVAFQGAAPTIGIDPALCDIGFLGAPVAYAFGPSPKFLVGGEGPFVTPTEADEEAVLLLTNALSASGLYYDDNDLLEYGPNIDWVANDADDVQTAGVDVVYWDGVDDRPDQIFLITQSAAGTWFCATADAFLVPTYGDGSSYVMAGEICLPAVFGSDEDG
jgi:hypothetical protein